MTVITLSFAAGSVALGFAPASSVTASAATSSAPVVGSDAHHDTSRPLRSYAATTTRSTSHPAKHGPPGPEGPPAADTSGGSTPTANAPAATNNFDGTPDNSGVIPSDDTGAAGSTQFLEIVNSQIAVYSKTGGLLLGPENTNTLWSGFGGSCQTYNDGDGTVQWDTLSQRWVVEQLEVSAQPFFICVAVSTSADATGTWNRYSFQYTNFPDYPKLGVWPDAYYLTVNQFNAAGTTGLGEETCALNRASMLTGAAASTQCFFLNSSGENTVLPATLNGTTPPAAGAPEWLVGISPTTANALAYWQLHVDWTTPANSVLSAQTNLGVTAFSEACGGAGTCVPQSGTTQKLDSLADRLMYDLPYRNFGDHESIMVTHSIVAGSSVGMRWYELRPSGSALGVFQSGTYAPDSTYRWMGSIGMDKSGDVALGYSTSSSTLHPGIAYTGRLASDAAGTMPQGETTLFTGGGSQIPSFGNPGSRWGDYSGMSVDPSDDCTFWYVSQYIPSNGDFNWHTRIGSFKFPSCGGVAGDDFSISASPASLTLQQSAGGSSTISTAVTSGVAGTVSLGVSGTPSGATASLSPASVTAGGSATLNVNAGTATPGSYTLTVTGTEGSATHAASVALTVTGSGGAVVSNGGFETGSLSSWSTGGVFSPTVTTTQKHSGTYAAQLGASSAPEPNGDSSLAQTVTVPAGSSTLSFWYWPSTTDSITYDWQEAQIRNTSGTMLASVFKVCSNAQAWTQVTFDMTPYAGQNVQLWFNAHGDGYGDLTYMYLDDVSLTQNGPPPSDFSISAGAFSPASATQGGSATSTITTAVTSGSAQNVALSASGLPSGAAAAFNPPSVSSGGSSTLTVSTASTTPPGTYPITITGTGTSATHSTSASLTVTGNDFSISANPASLSLAQGAAGSSTISTAVTSGSAATVSLSVSGTPSGATATLNPTSVTAGGTAALNVSAGTAAAGSYTLTVTGTEGAATHSTTVSLAIDDFSISASPASLTLAPNTAGTSTISTTVSAGAASTVSLSVSGVPAGAAASVSPASVTAGGSATLNVNAGTATPGSYTLTVSGSEGTATHSTSVALTVSSGGPPPGLLQVSSDSFTDPNAEHATQVEPDTLSNGTTMVSVFQVGRFNNGGADGIGFATTTNGGVSWTQGLIPGLTSVQGGSPNLGWARVSDPAVAYNPKAGMWIVEALTLDSSVAGRGVAVATSPDGVTWSAATNAISQTTDSFDKSWIVCDTTSTSTHYGNCYIEFDDNSLSNTLRMITSTDGGTTWSVARGTSDTAHGLGGQPLVQPNGNVVVPYFADSTSQIRAFVSTNGGSSWNSSRSISSVTDHAAAGGLRTLPLPSAEIDSSGRVYVVWQDCRFRSGCTANDIVMSKSTNGTSWSSPTRIPIDATTSGVDHFIPGLAVDRSTSGSTAHLGLYYYYYPVAACGSSCSLDVGFVSSINGGSSWGSSSQVAGPMTLSELAPTTQGPMVGDYMSASFLAGKAWAVFAVGLPGSGGTLNEAMYTLSGGLAAPGGTNQPTSGGGHGTTRSHSSTAF